MSDPRHTRGLAAERVTAAWLRSLGWRILARRWRSSVGELDLVCLDPLQRLVGVEVRLRRNGRSGSPLESVTPRHRARLRAALVAFVVEHGTAHRGLRIDLVAVLPAADRQRWRLQRHAGIDAW